VQSHGDSEAELISRPIKRRKRLTSLVIDFNERPLGFGIEQTGDRLLVAAIRKESLRDLGLKKGYQIYKIAGKEVHDFEEARKLLRESEMPLKVTFKKEENRNSNKRQISKRGRKNLKASLAVFSPSKHDTHQVHNILAQKQNSANVNVRSKRKGCIVKVQELLKELQEQEYMEASRIAELEEEKNELQTEIRKLKESDLRADLVKARWALEQSQDNLETERRVMQHEFDDRLELSKLENYVLQQDLEREFELELQVRDHEHQNKIEEMQNHYETKIKSMYTYASLAKLDRAKIISIRKTLNELIDRHSTCGVCFDRERDTALTPCGHQFCHNCAASCNRCPICRGHITQRLKLKPS